MKHGYLIDMDGVIYRGSEVIPGATEFIRHLQESNIPYLFLTNNSTYTALDVVVKLRKFDIVRAGGLLTILAGRSTDSFFSLHFAPFRPLGGF